MGGYKYSNAVGSLPCFCTGAAIIFDFGLYIPDVDDRVVIGTFYRSSSPDKPSFVSVGDEIKPGQVICIVEAMKLFNEIESEISGRIVKVLVDDASPIEYDQPLFLVEPA